MSRKERNVKVVVVGDGAVGKTCLLQVYKEGEVDFDKYIPTVMDNYTMGAKTASGEQVTLSLWDTAGQEAYDRLRTISYPSTNVFLVCFSVGHPISLENVREKWQPEIAHHCPRCPFLLVATKTDLRVDAKNIEELRIKNRKAVTYADGMAMAKKLDAADYVECSALTNEGVKEVFNKAIAVATKSDPRPRRPCFLL